MARIFLIRHGETQANTEKRYQGQIDTPLNDTGLAQAEQLASTLQQIPFDRFYTTSLKRAQKTAEIVAAPHKRSPVIIPELAERNFGRWENMTAAQIKFSYPDIYTDWLKAPNVPIPDAEPFGAFGQRVLSGLEKAMYDLGEEETIAIIAHGGPNRIMLHHFLGSSVTEHFWKIKQDNACVNIIDIRPGYQLVSLLNFHSASFQKESIKY